MTRNGEPAVDRTFNQIPSTLGTLVCYHYPSLWAHILPDHAILFFVKPVSPSETEVITTWLTPFGTRPGNPPEESYDKETLTEVWIATNNEDKRLIENHQRGVMSPMYEPGPLHPNWEAGVVEFNKWYCKKMERNGYSPASVPEQL
jgi:Rieske 2Fe-2S family protein